MNENHIIKISLYDDNQEIRLSLSKLFATSNEIRLTGSYAHANQVIENCKYKVPDVILMDIDMPGITGVEAVHIVKSHFPDIKVLMFTVFEEDQKVFESICNGAVGYILKKSEPLLIIEAVKDAFAGGSPMTPLIATKVLQMFRNQAPVNEEINELTEKERGILLWLTRGYSYKMIASECQVSIDTVRFHIKKIYEKLHVHSMTEAVSKALKNKWV